MTERKLTVMKRHGEAIKRVRDAWELLEYALNRVHQLGDTIVVKSPGLDEYLIHSGSGNSDTIEWDDDTREWILHSKDVVLGALAPVTWDANGNPVRSSD